jgi:septum site-determining protein MinC
MTDAPRAQAPACLDIKSANLPLVALMLKSTDLQAVHEELNRRLGDVPDFFDNEPLLIDLSGAVAAARRAGQEVGAIDFAALLALLAAYKVKPIAVRGGSAEHMQAAQAAGLLSAPDARVVATSAPSPEPASTPEPSAKPAPEAVANAVADAAPEPASDPSPPSGALLIDKPLRSGQQVYARGRDLVVMAMVNAGAEVIADGSIHVYAPLRGKAIAGARGNQQARIFAQSLEAELLSIAGIYRTSEVPLPPAVRGKSAMVRLLTQDGEEKLIMQALGA